VGPSGSECVFLLSSSCLPFLRLGGARGSYVASDAYAQLIVLFLLAHSVEQVANVVLYSSDYYTKVVAAEEVQ